MGKILNEVESGKIIKKYLPLVNQQFFKTGTEIKPKLKFPLFVKGVAEKITHAKKMGFLMKVNTEKDLTKTILDFKKNALNQKIKLDGILAQEMAVGQEFIIGIKKDKTFGHVIMLGIGGSHAEELKDVTFRLCPINKKVAESMLLDLKNQAILKMANQKKLVDALEKISKMPADYKNLLELDLNPVIINEKDALVVDTLIVLE